MNPFDCELNHRLDALRQQGLLRELRRVDSPQSPRIVIDRRALLNFSSNDYLGLANDPALKTAAIQAIERFGAGAGASRLVSGSLAPHQELDETLAAFKGTEAALSFATGFAAALGTIGALLGKDDIVIIDRLVHASIVDAVRLSGAKLRVFAHNDLNDLERILKWADGKARHPGASEIIPLSSRNGGARPSGSTSVVPFEGRGEGVAHFQAKFPSPQPSPRSGGEREPVMVSKAVQSRRTRVLVVTETVFSMDGDHAPLREIVSLKDKYGAWLMVDEAHATGLYGKHRRGLAEALGVSDRIEIQMGTLGKALGASGGYICGSRVLIDYLINSARTFIFSTAPVPAAAAAATAGIRFVQSDAGNERRNTLWQRVAQLQPTFEVRDSELHSAIRPILLGGETRAVEASAKLRNQGFFIPAIRFPAVARGQARLRLTVTASHTAAEMDQLLEALESLDVRSEA